MISAPYILAAWASWRMSFRRRNVILHLRNEDTFIPE